MERRTHYRTDRHLRNRYLLLSDVLGLVASLFVAFCLRFESLAWAPEYQTTFARFLAVALPLRLAVLYWYGLYRRLWRYAGVAELERILFATATNAVVSLLLGAWLLEWMGVLPVRVPLSIMATDALLAAVVVGIPRLLPRLIRRRMVRPDAAGARRVLVVGAGSAGEMIVRQLRAHPELGMTPVGFLDDDLRKQNMVLCDLPVFGNTAMMEDVVAREQVNELLIAIPSAPGGAIRAIMQRAMTVGLPARTMPGLFEILTGRVRFSHLRPVQIEDLLRREPVRTDLELVAGLIAGRVVLVTGAGGSIGSELCRQIAALKPARLVLLGHGENELFDIQNELKELHPGLEAVAVVADVRNRTRLAEVFRQHRPSAVFHAAAHKHVPLMEENVTEAVTNNIQGTRNVAELAVEFAASHMVLISTDKAVRPTSVMGASKRVAEQVVQQIAMTNGCHFIAVRFGNVLGSRGSVVPAFLRQIEAGGPVMVTHPGMRRYFMTIPESVQLVLQAAVMGKGGEVFVLDMGDPIKIVDLASDLIRLSGLEVDRDIEIRFTGVRPGEKLYEELFFGEEVAVPTDHPKILKARQTDIPAGLQEAVAALVRRAESGAEPGVLRNGLLALVPDYNPANSPHSVTAGRGERSGSTRPAPHDLAP